MQFPSLFYGGSLATGAAVCLCCRVSLMDRGCFELILYSRLLHAPATCCDLPAVPCVIHGQQYIYMLAAPLTEYTALVHWLRTAHSFTALMQLLSVSCGGSLATSAAVGVWQQWPCAQRPEAGNCCMVQIWSCRREQEGYGRWGVCME
jgi:hypothetical protein